MAKLGKSQREKDLTRVASVAAMRDGTLLFGKRNDNQRWTLPGGHLNPGESPLKGALRELLEETGLKPESMEYLGSSEVPGKNMVVYAFSAKIDSADDPDGSDDPDGECSEFRWVDSGEVPAEIMEHLHSPKNVTLQLLDLQEKTLPLETEDDSLYKGMGSALAAIAVGAALSGTPHSLPTQHEQPAAHTMHVAPKWSPKNLHHELHPIAHLESRFGQDMDHKVSSKGSFDTAYGAVGLKPMTAHEEYKRTPVLLQKYPKLTDPSDFEAKFKSDPTFYNEIASAHWKRLRSLTPSAARAAYSWRFGLTAQAKASDEDVANAEYVKKFLDMLRKDKKVVKKSEELGKVVLNPNAGYKFEYKTTNDMRGDGVMPGTMTHHVNAFTADGSYAGQCWFEEKEGRGDPELYPHWVSVHPNHMRKGLASAMYAHAEKMSGLKIVPSRNQSFSGEALWTGNINNKQFGKAEIPDLTPHLTNDLRHAKYQGNANPLAGHCYVASEALYHHLGGAASGWVPQFIQHEGSPHWYLKHKETGEIIDPTASQFQVPVPYESGTGKGFLTRDPSRRARVVLDRLHQAAQQNDSLAKADPVWRSRDGISIPKHGTQGRKAWNQRFYGALVQAYGNGDQKRLKPIKVKLSPALSGGNMPVNKDRLNLYRKMARKDRLPPIIVRRAGLGFNIVDGNHRHAAAEEAGLPHMDAYEILDPPMKKSEVDLGSVHLELWGRLGDFDVYKVDGSVVRNTKDVDFTNGGNPERYSYVPEGELWVEGSNDQDRAATALHEYTECLIMKTGVDYDHAHDRASKVEKQFREAGGSSLDAVQAWVKEHKDLTDKEIELGKSMRADAIEIGMWLLDKQALVKSGAEGNLQGEGLEGAHSVALDMLGNNPRMLAAFEAARFLTGGRELPREAIRSALYEHDDDFETAALHAYGIPEDEAGFRALRACMDLGGFEKAEEEHMTGDVKAGAAEARSTADEVARAFKGGEVSKIKLGGKHSQGTLVARDPQSQNVWLLKPGSGGISPASGVGEEGASQSRREAAFWHVAEAWALENSVPRADLLVIDGKEYAAIRMLPYSYKNLDKKAQKEPSLPRNALDSYRTKGLIHKWAVLDFVCGQPDRHLDNMMVSKDNAIIALIDAGSAFAGEDFDPAHDKNSFVPGYLRVWGSKVFNRLPVKDKLEVMPEVSEPVRKELMEWLDGIHADRLEGILNRYGIDPRPTMIRLAKVKMMASQMPVDKAVNRLWVTV